MANEDLIPINGVHGTLVTCETREQIQHVFDFIEYSRNNREPTYGSDGYVYIGTNTSGGAYTLSSNKHDLAGETISYREFELLDNPSALYSALGMEDCDAESK